MKGYASALVESAAASTAAVRDVTVGRLATIGISSFVFGTRFRPAVAGPSWCRDRDLVVVAAAVAVDVLALEAPVSA